MKLLRPIIVTGADGMGKSTLYNTLTSSPYNFFELGHEGGPIENRIDAAHRIINLLMAPPGIQDRSCLVDDWVYTHALNRVPQVDWKIYDQFLEVIDPVIIYCLTSEPQMVRIPKGHKTRALAEAVFEHRTSVWTYYDRRARDLVTMGLDLFSYDYKETLITDLLEYLVERGALCAD